MLTPVYQRIMRRIAFELNLLFSYITGLNTHFFLNAGFVLPKIFPR